MTVAFVTGASGQDGSYLVDRLLSEGVEVHGLIRAEDPDATVIAERHPDLVLHVGDLADPGSVAHIIGAVSPDEIYNLAGISSVAQSWELPVVTGEITGVAVAAVLDAALRLNGSRAAPVRVLQASSSEIFGNPNETPQTEATLIAPTSPYGAAKAYAHHMVRLYRARGLHASSVILYNHESPRRPEAFVTRKITATVARIAAGLTDRLEIGALDVRRDWGWAPDYVDAMIRAIRHDTADDFVIATGEQHSVADFIGAAFAAVGIADWKDLVSVNPAFVRPIEITTMLGDASKAKKILGWQPTVTFSEIVERMVEEDVRLLEKPKANP